MSAIEVLTPFKTNFVPSAPYSIISKLGMGVAPGARGPANPSSAPKECLLLPMKN